MHVLAPVAPPDLVKWGMPYLRTALAGRSEPVAASVLVSYTVPDPRQPKMVILESDGGHRLSGLRFAVRLRAQVWAATEKDTADLAQLVYGVLSGAPGSGPVVAVSDSSGPFRVADPDSPKQFLNFEFITSPVVL